MYDDTGAHVPVPPVVARVVSLVPSLTESVAASAPGLLVGATDWCSHPPDLEVTRVKGTKSPDLAVVAVPYDGHADLLRSWARSLAGKVVVDCVNPLGFDQQGAYALPVADGSAAQEAAAILVDSTVVAAFHHVSAALLDDPEVSSVDTDVLVLGDDRDATDLVASLADVVPGMRGVYGGRLRNAHQVEALTANLISVNRRYKAHAGIRVTDI